MNKILTLEIFDAILFESDAEQWLKLCKDQKREWILKNTSQTDESLITEFINNPKISKECKCLDCGKNKKYVNISNRIPKEATAVSEPIEVTGNNKRGNNKRGNQHKKS